MAFCLRRYLPPADERSFLQLTREAYRVTSKRTDRYNCIAFAAGDRSKWWWPDPFGQYYWPRQANRDQTVDAFVEMFRLFGYEECDNPMPEIGFEKRAIYFDRYGTAPFTFSGMPTHAARQLVCGEWQSKLGPLEDIRHRSLDCLNGRYPAYGEPVKILRRPTRIKSTGLRKVLEFIRILWQRFY